MRLEQIKSMLVDDPEDSFLLFALAKEYEYGGQVDDAIAAFENLRKKHPSYVGLYYHLAKLYIDQNKQKLADSTIEVGLKACEKAGDKHAHEELQSLADN